MIIKHNLHRKLLAKQEWHKWFAWFPVTFMDGNQTAWLCFVKRKAVSAYPDYFSYWYRELGNHGFYDDEKAPKVDLIRQITLIKRASRKKKSEQKYQWSKNKEGLK